MTEDQQFEAITAQSTQSADQKRDVHIVILLARCWGFVRQTIQFDCNRFGNNAEALAKLMLHLLESE